MEFRLISEVSAGGPRDISSPARAALNTNRLEGLNRAGGSSRSSGLALSFSERLSEPQDTLALRPCSFSRNCEEREWLGLWW